MGSARKPVIVRKLSRDWCAGYATPNSGAASAELELLDSSGKLLKIEWNQIKWVCYVRELTTSESAVRDAIQPERLLRRRFASRPRIAGLWLRLILTDGDELEGVAANDRSLIEDAGLMLTPPDTRSNTQRVFVPHGAIRELTVLGVLQPTTPRRPTGTQSQLFENDSVDSTGESDLGTSSSPTGQEND